MIETHGLTRTFGDNTAVDALDLKIRDGEVFGFIGPNGAGKTTTVRMLCCLIAPTAGTAYVHGLDVNRPEEALQIRGKIGLLPEVPGLYESLSAYRNLDFYAQLYDVPKGIRAERIESLLRTLGMWERRDDAVGKFSKGMKQKIAIARALVHEPDYLFLDEPTSGLDPEASLTVRNYLLDLKKEGRTIFLNTHNLDDAARLCDRVGVMRTSLLAIGSPDELAGMFWGHTTVVRMRRVGPGMTEAVGSLPGVTAVRQEGTSLLVDAASPDDANPLIMKALVSMGGEVLSMGELKRGLEDVYLKLLGGKR